jgi:hypothetical protein
MVSTPPGENSLEDLNNIHLKHNSVNTNKFGNFSMNTVANNLSDSVLPLQLYKDKSFQVSYQADMGSSVANLASHSACSWSSSQTMNAEHQHVRPENRIIHVGVQDRGLYIFIFHTL